MKVITVTNRKGGIGKTTCAAHIAAGLATLGYNVCLVDTDSQGHAARMVGMDAEDGLYDMLVNKAPLSECVRSVPLNHYATLDNDSLGYLCLLPSSDKTYKIPLELDADEPFLFLDRLREIGDTLNIDVFIIDTQPTKSLFDSAIYIATDAFIYVTELEQLSFDGLSDAITQMQGFSKTRERYLGRGAEVIGIIPNKMRVRTKLHREYLKDLGAAFPGLVWPFLRLQTVFAEATVMRQPLYTYAPTSNAAADCWNITHKTREAIAAWQTTV